VSPAKTAELIEIPFRLRTLVGAGSHVDGVQIPHGKGQFRGKNSPLQVYGLSTMSCARTAEWVALRRY